MQGLRVALKSLGENFTIWVLERLKLRLLTVHLLDDVMHELVEVLSSGVPKIGFRCVIEEREVV